MKNIFFFERPFKIQKNGVFLFELSFFVLEILMFFYYAKKISDDVILFASKNDKILNNDISGNIKAVFLKLGTINVHHKRNDNDNDTFNVIAMATVWPLVLS